MADTVRGILETHIITPKTLVTLHIPPLMEGMHEYCLSGQLFEDHIIKYYDRPYRRMEYEADTDFCDLWLAE